MTFGIKPTKPETGYGYIEIGSKLKDSDAYKVAKFYEKPDLKAAQNYLIQGNFYWNSGVFAFPAGTILEEFQKHSPDIFEIFEKYTFEQLVENFKEMPNISIDYAVMEKTNKAVVIPLDIVWPDCGFMGCVLRCYGKRQKWKCKKWKCF